MSTLNSILAEGNMPLFIVAVGLVVAGLAMIAVAIAKSQRIREISEE